MKRPAWVHVLSWNRGAIIKYSQVGYFGTSSQIHHAQLWELSLVKLTLAHSSWQSKKNHHRECSPCKEVTFYDAGVAMIK